MNEIRLYDAIGQEMDAEWLAAQIPPDAEHVTVRINSPGGAVSDGLAMYHYLRDHQARITTIVDGYAASAASIVMLAGDDVQVHQSSIVMIHNPWTMAVGNADELRHTAAVLDEHAEAILDIYQKHSGMDRAELSELVKAETWMRGEAAVEHGFAGSIIEDSQTDNRAAACVQFAQMLAAIEGGNELMKPEDKETAPEVAAEVVEPDVQVDEPVAEVEETEEQPETHSVVDEPAPKTRKEAVAQVEAAKGEIVSLDVEVVAIRTERDDLLAKVCEMEADAAASIEAHAVIVAEKDEAIAAREMAETERDGAQAELDKARKALSDPQYVDAALVAHDEPLATQDAESSEDEPEAVETTTPIYDEYFALKQVSPRLARSYYREHQKEIADEQKALAAANATTEQE